MSDQYLQPGQRCPRTGCEGVMAYPGVSGGLVACSDCHYTQGVTLPRERDYTPPAAGNTVVDLVLYRIEHPVKTYKNERNNDND